MVTANERIQEIVVRQPFSGAMLHRFEIDSTAQKHESVAHLLVQLEERKNGFALPNGASASRAALIAGMRTIKADLDRHLELENGILFPRPLPREETKGV